MINPAKYPAGWRKVRIGSREKVGDRFIEFTEPISSKLSDWSEITEPVMCASASAPDFTVIRKIEKK